MNPYISMPVTPLLWSQVPRWRWTRSTRGPSTLTWPDTPLSWPFSSPSSRCSWKRRRKELRPAYTVPWQRSCIQSLENTSGRWGQACQAHRGNTSLMLPVRNAAPLHKIWNSSRLSFRLMLNQGYGCLPSLSGLIRGFVIKESELDLPAQWTRNWFQKQILF